MSRGKEKLREKDVKGREYALAKSTLLKLLNLAELVKLIKLVSLVNTPIVLMISIQLSI